MTEVAEMNIAAMSDTELKSALLSLIDRTEKRAHLELYAVVLQDAVAEEAEDEATFWSRYTPEARTELEKAFEESYDLSDGIPHEEMKKKHAKWLNG